jgi:hypothetical protein
MMTMMIIITITTATTAETASETKTIFRKYRIQHDLLPENPTEHCLNQLK